MIGIFINLWNRLTGGGTPAPTPALLDTYGGAAAAFSLRKLSSTYGGSAVRVRRSLDNTEQDIGFSGDNLDEAALQAFVGYENLFLVSESFTSASWGKSSSTVTANAGTDPFGGNNATRYLSNTGTSSYWLGQNIALTVGQSYTMSVWVKSNTGVNQTFRIAACNSTISSGAFTATNDWQRFTFTFVANSGAFQSIISTNFVLNLDVLIFGAQLNQGVTAQTYQQTGAVRNTANGFVTRWYTQDGNGENLLLQSQTFEAAQWTKTDSSASANTTTAPDGTLTADTIIPSTAFIAHYVIQTVIKSGVSQIYTISAYVKAAGYTAGSIGATGLSTVNQANFIFDLTTLQSQAITNGVGFTNISSSLVSVGNGWFRVSMTFSSDATTAVQPYIRVDNAYLSPTYSGNGTSGLFVWGAQLSQSSWLQGYQATTTTAVSRRDASQATAASQPRIVNAGVIVKDNNKPSVRFGDTIATGLSLASNINLGTVDNYVAGVVSLRGYTGTNMVWLEEFVASPLSRYVLWFESIPDRYQLFHNTNIGTGILASLSNQYLISTTRVGTTSSLFQNSINQISGTASDFVSANTLTIGNNSFNNQSWLGVIKEIVIYPSDQTSVKQSIESNINNSYQIYWQGTQQALLDQFGGSAAAFSLRNLSSSYRGPLVRVRRSNDNAETDIGGTFGGDLDVNSLLAFTGGQNLVAYSQEFDISYWTKEGSTITANATIAPDGTLTADKLAEQVGTSFHRARTTFNADMTITPYTFSAYVKAAERRYVQLQVIYTLGNFNSFYVIADLLSGTIYRTGAANGNTVVIDAAIQNAGNGWYRISVSGRTGVSGSTSYTIAPLLDGITYEVYAGVAGSGVYIWGAQLNTGILQPYIPTTTAAINGANAFVTKWYDQSGIGDNLLLQSQTFENASWIKVASTVSANTITAPDGTLTGETMFETATTDLHYMYQTNTTSAGVYTLSLYIKYLNKKYVLLNINDALANGAGVVFDIETATFVGNSTIGTGYSVLSYSITNLPDGWSRYSVTISTSGAAMGQLVLRNTNSLSWLNSYAGNTSTGVYIWGGQLSLGSELLRYQPTTTAIAPKRDAVQTTAASQPRIVNAGSVESENGKPSIFFDGIDDRLATSAAVITSSSFSTFSVFSSSSAVNAAISSQHNSAADVDRTVFLGSDLTELGKGYLFYGGPSSTYLLKTTSSDVFNGTDSIAFTASNNGLMSIGFRGVIENTLSAPAWTPLNAPLSIGSTGGATPTSFIAARIQELGFYPTYQTSYQSISSNMNTYYGSYWQGNGIALLDSFSGASAAYSLRNLSSAYTGPLIRVRRSSDNVERDIYGTFRGDLDLAALTSFVGANSGFVTTWYDQSGTGRHATQATAGSQPRIVNAGAVETINGKPSVFTNATNVSFSTLTLSDFTLFWVSRKADSGPAGSMILYGPSVNYVSDDSDNSGNPVVNSSGPIVRLPLNNTSPSGPEINQHLSYANRRNGTQAVGQFNNSENTYNNSVISDQLSLNTIGIYPPVPSYAYNGHIQEILMYPDDRSSSRTGMSSNINNYYKIY